MVTNSCMHRTGGRHRYEYNLSGTRRYCRDCGEAEIAPSPAYDEIMADSRRALWYPIDTMPRDRDILITRRYDNGFWFVRRRRAGSHGTPTIGGTAATHWCEDILGSPVA